MRKEYARFTVMAVLILLVVTAYAGVWNHRFINFDDPNTLTANSIVRAGLSLPGVVWAFTAFDDANWIPLTRLSHIVLASFYGVRPGPHLFFNVLLHAANACLLFEALRRLTRALWRSAAVAVLFAIHPQHVESVAWLTERKDVLFMFFGLLALISYARYARGPSLAGYVPVFVFFAMGLMSKPMLVSMPVLLLLLDVWPLGRIGSPANESITGSPTEDQGDPGVPKITLFRALVEKLPLGMLSFGSCILTMVAQHANGAVKDLTHIPFGVRLANSMHSVMIYAWETLIPTRMAVFVPIPVEGYPLETILGSWGFLICGTVVGALTWKTHKFITVMWLWFLISLLPVIGLVQVGIQAHADRYAYLPCIGLYVVIVWSAVALVERFERNASTQASAEASTGSAPAPAQAAGRPVNPAARNAAIILFTLVVITYYSITWTDVGYWKDTRTLFTRANELYPANMLAQTILGDEASERNDVPAAIGFYQQAIESKSDYYLAYNNMGTLLLRTGHPREAFEAFSESVKINPSAYESNVNLARVIKTLGGKPEQAIQCLDAAIATDPKRLDAYYDRAWLSLDLGRYAEAETDFRFCLQGRPDWPQAMEGLGQVFFKTDRPVQAADWFKQALRLAPNVPELADWLAKAQASAASKPSASTIP